MRKVLGFILLSGLMFCCKDDDIVANRTIFTMSFDGSWSNMPDTWIVLRDDDSGELIDSRMVDITKSNVFESKKRIKSGKMTVSYIWAFPGSGATATVQVFSGVDVGSEWTYFFEGRGNYVDPTSPGNTGRYNLTVTNVPPMYGFTVSTKYGTSLSSNTDAQYNNGTVTVSPYFSTGVKQLITIDPQDGKQKYLFVENVTEYGQNVTVDYNDFQEFFRYVHFQGGGSQNQTIAIYGTEEAKYYYGYQMYDVFYGGYAGPEFYKQDMEFGILDEVPINRIEIDDTYSSYSFYGRPPTGIVPPYFQLLIEDTSYDKFRVKGDDKYLYSKRQFVHYADSPSDVYIDATFYAPAGQFKNFNPITEEIASKYSLKIDKLNFRSMQAITGDQSYQGFLDAKFEKDYDTTQPYEIFRTWVPRLN